MDGFPDPPPVLRLIQERGRLSWAEMSDVFSMGIGLCVILPGGAAPAALDAASRHGFEVMRGGRPEVRGRSAGRHRSSRPDRLPVSGIPGPGWRLHRRLKSRGSVPGYSGVASSRPAAGAARAEMPASIGTKALAWA